MENPLSGKVIVITGASTGIGRATALKCAQQNTKLVLSGRREDALQALAQECEKLGGRALSVVADVTDNAQVEQLVQKAISHFGGVDVYVNNAAVTLFGRIEDAPYEAYRKVIDTNLFGYIHGARAVIPHFREKQKGSLINVSSMVGKIGSPYLSAYCISKSGILGLSDSLRMELQDVPGIHVSTVLPASIDTPLFQHSANFTGRAIKPMPPIYSADEVADAIVMLIQQPQREVYVGGAGRRMSMLHTFFPALAERLFARQVSKTHFQDKPALQSPGNLFQPMAQLNRVDGGWQPQHVSHHGSTAAIVGAAAVVVGVGWLLATRRYSMLVSLFKGGRALLHYTQPVR